MDQFITQPLKRFLYNSKEYYNNYNTVMYKSSTDEAQIKMAELKPIIKSNIENNISPKKINKNTVLFNDSIETISLIEFEENAQQLVKVTMNEEPEKQFPTILNLSQNQDVANLDESDGEIQVENNNTPNVIKIKVKIVNKTEPNISGINTIQEAKSIEEFQNCDENRHVVDNTCIFDENKTEPLSPILPAKKSPKTQFKTVDNLINFHERQVHKIIGKTPSKTLPRMGTSALLSRTPSKSKLNDSEIIHALVHDRFVVNMYESRSFRRNFIKKPSTYGRVYKTIERNVNLTNDYITNNLLNNEIVAIKQSSPKNPSLDSSVSIIDQISEDIKNISICDESINEENKLNEEYKKTPSSEYGSGSSSMQNSTISLEQKLSNVPRVEEDDETFGSEISSYNMEEFLKKALGDEMLSLDTTETESKTDSFKTPEKCEESICTSNASDLISKINTFQSNVYRSFTRKLQNMTDTFRIPHNQMQNKDKQSIKSDIDSLFSNNEEVTVLLKEAAIQYETLKQISKALAVCRNSKEFCISSEQVEGERLLLVATYKRQAILDEIRRLEYSTTSLPIFSEIGTLSISNIFLPLKPSTPEQPRSRDLTKWYVGVFSSGMQVFSTQPTPAAADGSVKFHQEMEFVGLDTGFEVNVEVYCLLQRKPGRNFSHESKYHINKDSRKSSCPSPKKILFREKSSQKLPPKYDSGIRASSFKLCGSLKLTVADLPKSGPWDLRGKIPVCSSLSGKINFTLKSTVQIPIKQSGFLTVGSESGGCVSWNRRWCVLDGHVIKLWNYPSEEESVKALRELDLKDCMCSKIQIADRSICARPRTLLLDVARKPKVDDCNTLMVSCGESYTIESYYLSADNLKDLNIWQEELDKVVQALRIWNVGFLS